MSRDRHATPVSTRNRQYRIAEAEESIDSDQDDIPDVYEENRRS
ncbi:hypothetical protein [Pseudarthrobacter sp. S9]